MKQVYRIFLQAFVLCITFFGTKAFCQVDNDYWIAFPDVTRQVRSIYPTNPPELFIVADHNIKVSVDYGTSSTTYSTGTGGVDVTGVPALSATDHKIPQAKGIHVYSPGGEPFKVTALFGAEENFASTNCIPTHALGTCYRVVCYPSYDSTDGINNIVTKYSPSFCVVSTDNNTQVTLTYPARLSYAPINVTLNKGEVYWINCGNSLDYAVNIDPTGIRVTSDKPVAVFAGHTRANVPYTFQGGGNDGYCNPLYEEMIPVSYWGQLYHAVSTPQTNGNVYRILADVNNTDVYIDGAKVVTLAAGEFYETPTTLVKSHEIYATKPIEVMQYIVSGAQGYPGWGPEMALLVPVESYFAGTIFKQRPAGGIGTQHAIVIAPTAYASKVRFNGTTLSWKTMTKYFGKQQYSYAVKLGIATGGVNKIGYTLPVPADSNTIMAYLISFDDDRDESAIQNIGYIKPRENLLTKEDSLYQLCGDTGYDTVRFINTRVGELIISSPVLTGSSFTLVSPSTFPDTIAGSSTKAYVAQFTNATPGTYSATLSFATNALTDCRQLAAGSVRFVAHKERAQITSAPASHDFGDVQCQKYETTVSETNAGTVDVTITDKTFSQSGLTILSPALPVTLKPGETKTFTVQLDGSIIPSGSYSSSLDLITQPCDLKADFLFTANRTAVKYTVAPNSFDFGVKDVKKTSNGQITFTNQNDVSVRLGGAAFDPSSFPGTITTTFPQTVAPKASILIDFSCTPQDTGRYSANIILTVDSACLDNRMVPVTAEAASMCLKAAVTGAIGQKPGDVVSIPIVLEPSAKFTSTSKIEVTVTYDRELLKVAGDPASLVGGTITPGISSQGSIAFTINPGQPLSSPSAPIATIPFQTLLAPRAEGTIEVRSIATLSANGEQITGTSCPVNFSLGAGCVKPDQLTSRSSATIGGIFPNPADKGVKISLNATGTPDVVIDIYDTFGRKVTTAFAGALAQGSNTIAVSTEGLATGAYFCRLTQNGKSTSMPFKVAR